MLRSSILSLIAFVIIISITSCDRRNSIDDIPLGPVTQTGTLTATGVSLMRRGTYVLSVEGKSMYYLESRTQDLQPFDGKEVIISGIAEANIEKNTLPVIIVEQVQLVGGTMELKEWKIPALGITINTPADWSAALQGETAQFTIASLTEPILTIKRITGTDLPPGERIFIQNRTGVRVFNDETLQDDVRFIDGDGLLSISFHPDTTQIPTRGEYDKLHDAFDTLISTLQFTSGSISSAAVITGSGSGVPCGGTAGVLCPEGFYCAITDAQVGVGKCVSR